MDIVLLYLGLWTCAIFLACLGYGKAFLKILRVSGVDWGLESASGLSLLILAGGILNLAHAISRISLTVLIVPGVVLFIWLAWSSRDFSALARFRKTVRAGRYPIIVWSLLGFVFLLMAIRIVGQLRPAFVDLNDDRQAYLAFPAKIIETGSYAADPFSERRITSSLGGFPFLATLPLVVGDLRSIAVMDQGIGILILVACVVSATLAMRVPQIYMLILVACVVATPIYRHNATAALIGSGLVAGVLLALFTPVLGENAGYRRSIVAGLILGALCTLKSTFIPAMVFIYGISAVAELFGGVRLGIRYVARHAITTISAVLVVLPWSIATKETCGTFLYPLLGHGYDFSAYNRVPVVHYGMTHYAVVRLVFAVIPLLIAAVAVLVSFGMKNPFSRVVTAGLLGSVIAAAFVAHSAFTSSFWRYTVPFAIVALWLAAALLLSSSEDETHSHAGLRRAVCAAALIAISLPLARGGSQDWSDLRYHGIKSYWTDLRSTLRNQPLLTQSQHEQLVALQAAVPVGAPLLAHVENNFGFDFARNPVPIFDTPGLAGPPPGPPIGEGSEAWASYLTSHSVRYIAFGRASAERGLVPGAFSDAEDKPDSPLYDPMAKAGGRISLQADKDFLVLSETHKLLFDDGRDVVIDLDQPIAPKGTAVAR